MILGTHQQAINRSPSKRRIVRMPQVKTIFSSEVQSGVTRLSHASKTG
jgi:hypothetical protein